ncbi:alpha/beta hydrolase [Nonomuraea sp. NBC_01738]|uniref:dienelactone hydrolase family protein n=1 Tax=Nonomuraea sp. NBC_01738 TaxID=2976003 RepID=UPI002E10B23D|nr:alpha/beta hydrolase [Nonomuraea sp. NBC_01738]
MHVISETTPADGVVERHFTLGAVSGVLWAPGRDLGDVPLVLLGHGGGQDKLAPGVVGRALRFVADCGFAVVAIDAPGHGGRERTEEDERLIAALRERVVAGLPAEEQVNRFHTALAARAVPEWRATLDAVRGEAGVGGPVGYWGLSMGCAIGVPLVAAEPRIAAAVLGLAGSQPPSGEENLAAIAARISVPVEFLLQWDDSMVPRDSALALFEALGSREKTLHANPGGHMEVPAHELDSAERFFTRHLTGGGTRVSQYVES